MSEDFDPTIPDSQQDDPILPEFPDPQEPEDPQAAQVDSPDQFQPADAPDDSEPKLADLKNQFEEYKLGQQVLFGQLQDQVSELLGERMLMQKQLSDLATKGAQNPPPDTFINPFGQSVIVAQEGASALQWQQRYVRQGVLVDFTGGLLCDNDTLPSALIEMASDEFALIPMVDPNGGSQCMRFIKIAGGSSGRLIPVTLSSDGGSAGDLTTQASWTYEVTSGADTLGTGESPLFQRPEFGAMTEGLVGIWDTADEVLVVTDEQPEIGDCEGTIVVSP